MTAGNVLRTKPNGHPTGKVPNPQRLHMFHLPKAICLIVIIAIKMVTIKIIN
jgi:hypothetical protein